MSLFVLVRKKFFLVHFVTFSLTVVEARNNLTRNAFFFSLYSTMHTATAYNIEFIVYVLPSRGVRTVNGSFSSH